MLEAKFGDYSLTKSFRFKQMQDETNFFSKQGKPSALSICDKTVQKLLRYYKNAECQPLLIN